MSGSNSSQAREILSVPHRWAAGFGGLRPTLIIAAGRWTCMLRDTRSSRAQIQAIDWSFRLRPG